MANIGWIGTGVMGSSMCNHLLDGGHEVYVYNRTASKADALVNKGAQWCDSPAGVARQGDFIFSIVGYPEDVEAIMMGDAGIIANARDGACIIDMTTSTPALAERIHEAATGKGLQALDAPVSGGDVGAKAGTLAIMAGGEKPAYEKVKPLFDLMGENIAYMGGPGKGQHTKMSNQVLIAGTMIGVIESLLYAYKAGMDLEEVIAVIGKGAASSWSVNNLGVKIARGDYEPGFFIKHFVKDMRIALDESRRMQLSLPGLALAEQFYTSAMSLGYEDSGTQGLYKVFEKLNGLENGSAPGARG
ncbi:MAG: NAD(P)-dependent oxidoreductase [Balneolales bacterium]